MVSFFYCWVLFTAWADHTLLIHSFLFDALSSLGLQEKLFFSVFFSGFFSLSYPNIGARGPAQFFFCTCYTDSHSGLTLCQGFQHLLEPNSAYSCLLTISHWACLHSFPLVAVISNHRLSSLNSTNAFSCSYGGQKSGNQGVSKMAFLLEALGQNLFLCFESSF